jgi:hypothetical protein
MNPIAMLDGSVQSQGVRVSARDWLDIGSEGWKDTSNKVKAAAYQAAKITGWTDDGLKAIMVNTWGPRIDSDVASFTLNLLSEFAKEFPVEQEEVYKVEASTKFKVGDQEITLES